jgi:hypothetical protein
MDNRPRLHALVDDMDEDELVSAEIYLLAIVHQRVAPQPSDGELDRLKERGESFQMDAEQRWRQSGQRSKGRRIVSGFGGGGGFGVDLQGRPNGKMYFSYSDDGNSVEEKLHFIAGQEVEIRDRFAISDDGRRLLYEQLVKSGGRHVTREEEFPFHGTDGNRGVTE